ncbi:hypothetical protein QBC35DRAFT_477135 [Podospora australis]|uniref:RanBP2-type domain-containing protein n=1 Tax=Podospora australis TaxID=1536484 RepID=A0AAN6WNK6_9PEZI|nr:hypothetical protein QBC35DRAFT_477135 [Podospora australis]
MYQNGISAHRHRHRPSVDDSSFSEDEDIFSSQYRRIAVRAKQHKAGSLLSAMLSELEADAAQVKQQQQQQQPRRNTRIQFADDLEQEAQRRKLQRMREQKAKDALDREQYAEEMRWLKSRSRHERLVSNFHWRFPFRTLKRVGLPADHKGDKSWACCECSQMNAGIEFPCSKCKAHVYCRECDAAVSGIDGGFVLAKLEKEAPVVADEVWKGQSRPVYWATNAGVTSGHHTEPRHSHYHEGFFPSRWWRYFGSTW